MSRYKAARRYVKKGWIVHPLSSPKSKKMDAGKKPIVKGWQKRTKNASEDQLKEWFLNKDYNIGLQCGKNSKVTVIDFDSYQFKAELFDGLDINTLHDERREGRGHYFFKYESDLASIKRKMLGIEILNDSNQVVLPPSVHKDGQKYKWKDRKAPLQKMPDELKKRFKNLFESERRLNSIISKCKKWVREIWKHQPDVHDENAMLAIAAELKTNGATENEIQTFCKILLKENYDKKYTSSKWKYVKKTPWRISELKSKLPSHLQEYIVKDRGRENNPEAIEPSLVNREFLYKKNYNVFEIKNKSVIFQDRKTKKEVARLRYDKDTNKYFDDNYRNEGITREVNETNSAYYLYYLESLKESGIPVSKKWNTESETCETRVYKKMIFDPVGNYWATVHFILCRTKNEDGEWEICHEFVPKFTPMTTGVKKHKIRSLYESGVPPKTLVELFGYKTPRQIQKWVSDLRMKCKLKRLTTKGEKQKSRAS